jgi:hypothetical protein
MSSKQQAPTSIAESEACDRVLALVKEQEQAQQELVRVNHQIQQIEDKLRKD